MAKKKTVVKSVRAEAPAPAKKTAAAKKTALSVTIDHPLEGELVLPGHYAIRVTAAGATQAQLRVDGGEWSECRESVGHFWHDWAPASGAVRLEARARSGKGRWAAAHVRACSVAG